ncbi:MAG TPA: enolase C-terminal domain-like protein [Silvibacterium sp.]|nr:enolase C-terminal domain-like protein [Silvibacterium sp.]
MGLSNASIEEVSVSAYTIPTDAPEADGTFAWDSTTLVVVEINAGGITGLGYTYGSKAIVPEAKHLAEKCLLHQSPFDIPLLHHSMLGLVRNDGSRGLASMAISALDIALWDLKARILGCPVAQLLGSALTKVAAYGSGGFTSYSNAQLTAQFSGWAESGLERVKMKVGTDPAADPERVRVARKAIGPNIALFVDANGAYGVKQALALANDYAKEGVSWFEEPVSSDHLADLRLIRNAAPAGMDVAAGEYGYDSFYFRRMLEAGAVDVLQLDATRCKGFTGFLQGAAVAGSFGCALSAHCAPTLHMHVACAVPQFRHVEYFHDHVRIERMLFDGFIPAKGGYLEPDRSAPGLGLTFKSKDAKRYAA